MNQFFLISQALQRSDTRKPGNLRHLPKLIIVIVSILGLLALLVR